MKSPRYTNSDSHFRKNIFQPKITIIILLSSAMTAIEPVFAETNAPSYFSNTYQEARDKFLSAAKSTGGNLENYLNPHKGAEDEALYTDVATFNLGGANTVLVVGSGTHGVEGFAGSGIQVGLLREGIAKDLPDNVGLLFYHALNPYGFSHLRRYNEGNVDLNRNFVNHSTPYPKNRSYDELAWMLEPNSLSAWESFKAKAGAVWYRITKGSWWLQSAISRGQYNHPRGLFFGGNNETWSNKTLQKIIQRHLSLASHVILIDVHTGLGKYGAAEVINEIHPGTSRHEWMKKCWKIRITNPLVGDAASPPISGPLKRGFERLLPNAEVIAVSLEFGTYPPSKVLWALRTENYLHHADGWHHPNASEIKEELKRVFYPQKEDWKRMVWTKGSEMVSSTLDCLR
ncbi:MAG: M14 family metallopeptidase [Sedimenticola sp.]